MHVISLTPILGAVSTALALPTQETFSTGKPKVPTSLPVVFWHGLGDTYNGEGLMQIAEIINETYPGTFIHSIYLNEDPSSDRNAGFIGHLDDQIALVCEQLKGIPELHSGFDAMGFSQGGQFLRGYVERCNDPPVRNLITWGSQHNGIADLPECEESDLLCKAAFCLLKRAMWTPYTRNNIIQAQFYRDPEDLERYLNLSAWLADINNEREEKNVSYVSNISSLEKFVMIKFTEETTVVPPDSSWFGEYNATSGEHIPLRDRVLYKEDWLGLKSIDKRKGLVFLEAEGRHMHIAEDFLRMIISKYLGPYNHV